MAQYSPQLPIDPIAGGSSRRLDFQWDGPEEVGGESDVAQWEQNLIPMPEESPPPDEKGKGVAGQPSKKQKLNKYGF